MEKANNKDYKEYIEKLAKSNEDYKEYIEKLAKEEFKHSSRRKRIRIYMSASTFKKYAPMLSLFGASDYDVVLIKANDKIPILTPGAKQPEYSNDLKVTAIEAKHNDLLSDKDSLGFIIHYMDFVLVYTGDTGYNPAIEKQYRAISEEYSTNSIILLAHLGGFKEYEKKFDTSKSVDENWSFFYKNHLGRLGLAKLVELLKPKICIISEFGEEFRKTRLDLRTIFQDVYGDDTFFIPADIGLCINTDNQIRLIDKYDDEKNSINTAFYPYADTVPCKLDEASLLYYYGKGTINEADLRVFLVDSKIRHYYGGG
jgi:hypothetical protein